MSKKSRTNKRRRGGSKRKTQRGGYCGCGSAMHGGAVSFTEDGTPKNAIPLNSGYYSNMDPSRMTESGRFLGGSRRRCTTCGKRVKRRGGSATIAAIGDPLGSNSKDMLSAFGTSAGASYNAHMTMGKSPDGLFTGASKPLV